MWRGVRILYGGGARPAAAGSRPCADDRARVLRHPYTAMKKPAWAPRMPRAGASRPAVMRLTGPDLDTRQPRGVTNPQPGEAAGAPQAGPTLERSLNPSTQATTNAVPGRAWPRKKPTPPSISRSPASIARPRPANPSTPPSRPGRLPSLRRDRASALSRQRRSVSGATPGSLAVCSTALASDEHEPRASANSPTAFALNSGVYPAPFDMVPSSPIELGETRNKKTVHIIINEKDQYRIYSK